jgi:GntR family transcriptional regulator/MocR family aminotransferase
LSGQETSILINLDKRNGIPLYVQIKRHIIKAIMKNSLCLYKPLPSTRKLSSLLKVSRNTVVLAYEELIESGYLLSRPYKGYFVNSKVIISPINFEDQPQIKNIDTVCWERKIKSLPVELHQRAALNFASTISSDLPTRCNIEFPFDCWRECSKDTVNYRNVEKWYEINSAYSSPELIKQIQICILNPKGICVSDKEILITSGSENAISMLSEALFQPDSKVGILISNYGEFNKLAHFNNNVVKLFAKGRLCESLLSECEILYTTPYLPSSTNFCFSKAEKSLLLKKAASNDQIIIEDCSQTCLEEFSSLTLKALDQEQRVIQIGSFLAPLSTGLQLGYIIAPPVLVKKLNQIKRINQSQVAINNQHSLALFLDRGYYAKMMLG